MDEEYFTIADGVCSLGTDGTREILVHLTGELDISARDALRDTLFKIIDNDQPGRLIVDLAHVTFIDSEAISAVIDGYLAAQAVGITYWVTNANSIVRRVFEVLDMQRLFKPGPADSDPEPGR